ncbi:hypothetical protein [Aliivibrio fischeri]|nr:hypothetical protein [Aliivibrio fischeri]MUK51219.1 hypothetical protein [Aliivibrio fischeri]
MPVESSDIVGTIKEDRLTWQSAKITSDGFVPVIWNVPLNLPSADKVVPGGPTSAIERTVRLSNSSGSVNVPLTIIGMSYLLSSNAGETSTTGVGTKLSGVSAIVKGAGTGNKVVTLSTLSSPFTHYRPIIKPVTMSVWLKAFKTADLDKGTYQGAMNYLVPYNYYRDGVLIRNTLQALLTIKIDYNPSQLHSVSVSGDGVIYPQYYGYPERLVGGATTYIINVTGVFPNEVNIGLKNTVNSDSRYQLLSQTTYPQTGIDYSVRCTNGCDGPTQIITDGEPNINGTSNRLKMRSFNNVSAQATITVSFFNKKLDELNNDTYLGSFVLIFEAGV